MSHNPVVQQLVLGRFERFTVEKGTVAVLFKNHRFERLAEPGERIGNTQADIVDTSPHALVWRAELPSNHHDDFFSCTFTLRYVVNDPLRMVTDSVTDTEALVMHVLEQRLRTRTREYALNRHAELERILTDQLDELNLPHICGLEFLEQPAVVFNFSEQARARIKELDRIEQTARLPQTAVHSDNVPSKEAAYRFQVRVNVRYQVTNLADMPYDTPIEAEQQLWPRLQRALRRAGRQYAVVDIAKAEVAMQDALDNLLDGEKVQAFGVELLTVDVAADLDETARQRYVELANIEHVAAMKKAELAGVKENSSFFTELISQNSWAVLAVAVSKGEVSLDDLYQRMSEAEKQQLEAQVDLLKTLRQDNMRDEVLDYEIGKAALRVYASNVMGTKAPGLTALEAAEHPDDASDAETEDDQ